MKQPPIRFGLMPMIDAARELPRTVLPLKSVRYQFVVRGGMADVELTQVYCQENTQALDCEYLFPLPADAAVYRCEANINGRVIRARIEERKSARKLVEEKKAAGYRTALVESERDNLFTLSLGNLQTQDVVEVKLAYLQPVRRLSDQLAIDLPLCPGVRYIPGNALLRSNLGTGTEDDTNQVPDASRITPPRIDGEHPDAAFIELDGQIEAAFLDGEVNSPSHKLSATMTGEMLGVTLAQGGDIPDRDLALRWKERQADQPVLRGWTTRDKNHEYALLELRAPDRAESTDAIAQDFYFLVDRSGSMKGQKWEKAIQALHGCIAVMSPTDRVAVTLFESSFHDFDAEPVPPAALMADPRFRQLASVGTDGGTEMRAALLHVLEQVKAYSAGRPAVLVLITDAEIGNEGEITALMRQHPGLPVHCFGIDTTLNDSLLLDLVRQQGGTWHALQPKDDIAAIVTQLGRTLRQPVLVNFRVPAGWELAAGAIPNLYAGQINFVSVRSTGAPEANSLKVLATDQRNAAVSLEFQLTPVQAAGPRLRWGKERLVALVAQNDKSAAIALSKETNLLCPLTAFVAWDDAEKVTVANHRLVQPPLAPLCSPMPRMRVAFSACRSSVAEDEVSYSLVSPLGETLPSPLVKIRNQTTYRIHDFMRAIGEAIEHPEYANLFHELNDWIEQTEDLAKLNAIVQILDVCEHDLKTWIRLEQRIQVLVKTLADKPALAVFFFKKTSVQQDERERLERFQVAVAQDLPESGRREVATTIAEMVRLEVEIYNLLADFLRHHANASIRLTGTLSGRPIQPRKSA